jgi:uncharacterized membrane protein YeaQ/YmgE (transglycosylase-associated protein family)/Zn finger protein HypA/HybF involved in hydrogenase expression
MGVDAMKERIAACPACGGPVTFQVSNSLVRVCPFCKSVVGRGDKKPEDHGKIADLVDLNSPLSIGMSGTYRNKAFHITGRVQYRHPSGAIWNEWYLSFPGDRWGWLAEAQGNIYLMFERQLKSDSPLAQFDAIQLGQSFSVREETLQVTEKATATVAAAEGEIPWSVRPGLAHPYVDLKSEQGSIGTLDFGDKSPKFYFGQRITLDALGIEALSELGPAKAISVQAVQVNCPNCAGTLQLFAPDESLRVTCPSCKALLDAKQGKLTYLETLSSKKVKPVLPLGSKGKLFGREYVVIGFMQRFVRCEGLSYFWTEYLLYNPEIHFRWLVKTDDNHWSFVEQIDYPEKFSGATTVYYQGQKYRLYDKGDATVSYVIGEFPWQVHIGEVTQTADFIAPPKMLSFERAVTYREGQTNEEVTVSRGEYITVDEIAQAFNVNGMRRALGVGAIQPAPKMGFRFLYSYIAFILILNLIYVLGKWLQPSKPPDGILLMIAIGLVTAFPAFVILYLFSFEQKRWRNSDYSPYGNS